jgi:lipoprotein-anchoring transpeptidase ErfK/SrfK
MQTMNRRDFIKGASTGLVGLVLPRKLPPAEHAASEPLPASLGRIATWWRQTVRTEPSSKAEIVTLKVRDTIIPLYAAVAGEAPWPSNPIWYQTDGGFIHSGYVQPVEDRPSGEVITEVAEPGFWTQVCVPFAEARRRPASGYVVHKLYHGTVYRVVAATVDDEGGWWYQLQDGVTWSPGPHVPTWSVRRLPPEELAPISPGRTDKWMQISIGAQLLTCFEGDTGVFSTRIGSGLPATATPIGEHRILWKRHTSRMIGGSGTDRYDLPGVAFPVYFTYSGVAIHGTYWHNDYGRRHSHGCVNVTNEAAKWIFRWADPVAPYTEQKVMATPGEGMRVLVVL